MRFYFKHRDALKAVTYAQHDLKYITLSSDKMHELMAALSGPAVCKDIKEHILELIHLSTLPKPKPVKKPLRKGSIYLATSGVHALTKIGFSNQPASREHSLQASDPTLKMVFISEPVWTLKEEEAVHAKYASKRIRGEWFDLSSIEIEDVKSSLCCVEKEAV